MCLAKAYVRSSATEPDGKLLMENVTQVEIDGDTARLKSLLGDVEELQGHISTIDFADSKIVLESA